MTTSTKIPVDSIVVPVHFVTLCEGWAGDIGCMLRAVASTGGLTLGTIRPVGCDSDEKWYLTLWRNFAIDVYHCCSITGEDHEDYAALADFEHWVDKQIARLEESYGLSDWYQN